MKSSFFRFLGKTRGREDQASAAGLDGRGDLRLVLGARWKGALRVEAVPQQGLAPDQLAFLGCLPVRRRRPGECNSRTRARLGQ